MPNPTDEFQNKTGLQYFWGRIKNIFASKSELSDGLAGKVDVVTGKGLSSNDYTTEEKTKLANMESGAEVNDIDTISVNGTTQTITNKNVNITVPTAVSSLTNDSGYQNATQVQTAIDNAVSGITGISFNFDYDLVSDLPAVGTLGTIYFIPDSNSFVETTDTSFVSGKKYYEYDSVNHVYVHTSDTTMNPSKTYYEIKSGNNVYEEYVWASAHNTYEMFGSATIDTSTLWSKSELTAITTAEIDDILSN